MNWRFLSSLAMALALRFLVVRKLGWSYRPFTDSFDLLFFGREVVLYAFLLAGSLALINAILGPAEEK